MSSLGRDIIKGLLYSHTTNLNHQKINQLNSKRDKFYLKNRQGHLTFISPKIIKKNYKMTKSLF